MRGIGVLVIRAMRAGSFGSLGHPSTGRRGRSASRFPPLLYLRRHRVLRSRFVSFGAASFRGQLLLRGIRFLVAPSSVAVRVHAMDIISQLQEQVNAMALLALNTFGTLQRDAPPVRLSPNYPEPATNPSSAEETLDIVEQPKMMSTALVQAAKKFDALVAALPLSGEEAQLKRIAELQAENEVIGLELQKQLEAAVWLMLLELPFAAAEQELKQVQELFNLAADNCLNLKKPD
ncbi:hypothetical protein MUK42_19217 [Musa troglodytarum]|uniref:Mediator of RNA polymerase II transcription subunit 21 n=1 Tax=Musa troglodytarum TaxID=320322 RepID=A0A9E7K473_9LILI|nr:hypothetical protein MUK42_19217 [Musa troglodytarum]